MAPLSLFTVALGLPAPWEVVDVACDPKSGRIDFHRAFAPGTRSRQGAPCALRDLRQDYPQVIALWARPNSGFSLRMEALLVTLCQAIAVFRVN